MQQTIISGVKNHRLLIQSTFRYYFRVPVTAKLQELISLFFSWEVLAGISLSASTSEYFEFASLQLPRFLAFLAVISFY